MNARGNPAAIIIEGEEVGSVRVVAGFQSYTAATRTANRMQRLADRAIYAAAVTIDVVPTYRASAWREAINAALYDDRSPA